jgi:hypothetical protein
MHRVLSRSRCIRWISVALLIVGVLQSATPSGLPSARAEASEPGLVHCTDWPHASKRDATTDQDQAIATFDAHVIWQSPGASSSNIKLPMIPPTAPPDPGWRVLKRPGQPFAVFYTETITSPHTLRDAPTAGSSLPTTAAGNIDRDGDGVPDYAELVATCMVTAHDRYKAYYGLDTTVDTLHMSWLELDYTDPASGRAYEGVYPVIIRAEKEAQTFSMGEFLKTGLLFVPSVRDATGASCC